MSEFKRIQRKRTKGWKMPDNTISVCRPGIWGNPFKIGMVGVPDAYAAVANSRRLIDRPESHKYFVFTRERIKSDLRGKNLACWCKEGEPCHADILLEIANS